MSQNENYIRGRKEFESKNYKSAIKYFTKALEQDPDDIQILIKRADAYLEIDDHDNCVKDLLLQSKLYTKLLRENQNDYTILFKRGEVYRYLNYDKKAAADFEKAIKINPEYVDAYLGLGYIKRHQGKDGLKQALNLFLRALSIESDNSLILNNIGYIYKKQENIDKAIEFYKKSIEVKGEDSWMSIRDLASIYSTLKMYDKAITCYKELLLVYPAFISVYSYISNIYEKTGDIDEAVFYMNTAISFDKENQFYYFKLSQLYIKAGNFKMALEKIEHAISIENRRSFLQHKAKILLKLGKIVEAEKVFDEVYSSWQFANNELKKLIRKREPSHEEINTILNSLK